MSAKSKNITLNSILNDKTSGSSELLSSLNKYFLKHVKNPSKIGKEIPLVKNSLKDFAAVTNYLKKLETLLKKDDNKKFEIFLAEFSQNESLVYDKISKNCLKFLKGRNKILTLSNSKTLFEVFSRLNEVIKNLEITVCESSPGKEGIIFADKLSRKGIKTRKIPDTAVSRVIPESDAFLTGADMILKNGNVVNKTGSKNAAIICKHYAVPFYVLASKNKFTNQHNFEAFSNNKMAPGAKKMNISKNHNSLFEEIDKKLVTKIISD